ncbi:MAG: hypothetical protein JW795_03845 [Chitinivibrionales bacterium]|nr:hypothetical protein [Chitinivibrionales bacterium]
MKRREFLNAITSTLSLVAAGAATSDATMVSSLSLQPQTEPKMPIGQAITRFEKIKSTIIRDKRLQHREEFFRQRGMSPFLLQEVFIALAARSLYDSLSKEHQKSDSIQSILDESSPIMNRAVLGMTTLLESLTDSERRCFETKLKSNASSLDYVTSRFATLAQAHDVSAQSIEKCTDITRKVLWRMRHNGADTVIQECVEMVDKVGRQAGLGPGQRRSLCTQWSTLTSIDDPVRDYPRVARSGECDVLALAAMQQEPQEARSPARGVVGGRCMLIGLVMLIAGIGSFFTKNDDVIALGLFGGITAGVLVMILGLILLIVGI